ncbi:MAG: hypothetical protein ACKE9I_09860 [Methylophagaceae bacterium]
MANPERSGSIIKPAKTLLKRIDIGLFIAMMAVLVSFLALVTSKQQIEIAQATQKASVLPVIQINMGYQYRTPPYTFKIMLTNSGPGIAYVQNVQALIGDKPMADYKELQKATMIGRMLGFSTFTEHAAAGFISPGNSVTPWQFQWGKSGSGRSSGYQDIDAYLRGVYGPPMKDVDIKACYCSVFNDCWTVRYSDRRKPKPIDSCGPDGVQDDFFQKAIEMRAAAKLDN